MARRIELGHLLQVLLCTTLVGLALALPASPASAAHGFVVNTTDDQVDSDPGNGVCATADSGTPPGTLECTLRAAIQEANAHPGADTITLFSGEYVRTVLEESPWEDASASGDLDITSQVTIQGEGRATTIIDAQRSGRVLHVVSGSLLLKDVTVTDGYSPPAHGGGIRVETNATLVNVDVVDNEHGAGGGGGIANFGTLSVTGGSISENVSGGEGGGVWNDGPTATLTGVALKDNRANNGGGGGILNGQRPITLENSTVSGNAAFHAGGGFLSAGQTIIRGSTIWGNSTAHWGGGFSQASNCASGSVNISNSTISGNTTGGAHGGGLWLSCTADLTNVTVANNDAPTSPGDGIHVEIGTTTLSNTIVANNGTQNCNVRESAQNDTFLVSGMYNLSSDGTCFTPGGSDLTNTNPLLGPLADNGGPTMTHALAASSPAVDGVAATDCPPPATDQRGKTRPAEGDGEAPSLCDIGSFERVDADGDGFESGETTETDDADPCVPNNMAGPCDADEDGSTVAEGDPNNTNPCTPTPSTATCDLDGDTQLNSADIDDDGDGQTDASESECGSNAHNSESKSPDFDGDNNPNCSDSDDDNDNVNDTQDAFDFDANESSDNDGDEIGDNADLDDDNDGVADTNETCDNAAEDVDQIQDGDGCPETDADNDSHLDEDDEFPTDADEWSDADDDGIGDNEDTDDDNDTVADVSDECEGEDEDLDNKQDTDGCPDTAVKSTVTASLKKGKIKGSVGSTQMACRPDRKVTLFKAKAGKDPKIGNPDTTSSTGAYALPTKGTTGKLYVKVAAEVLDPNSSGVVITCGPATSDTVRVK